MTKVTLDNDLRSKLNGLNVPLELCDESGQTVGHFLPEDQYRQLLYAWLNTQVTDDELDRASAEPGGHTLDDLWQTLGRK